MGGTMIRHVLCASMLALSLAACGGIDTRQVMPTLVMAETAGNPKLAGKCSADENRLSSSVFSASVTDGVPMSFRDNKVVSALLEASAYQSAVTVQTLLRGRYDDIDAQVAGKNEQQIEAVATFNIQQKGDFKTYLETKTVIRGYQTKTLHAQDFKEFGNLVADLALDPTIRLTPGTGMRLAAAGSGTLIEYFEEYFNGEFVDRFGTQLPKPAISRTINNQFIAGALTVVLEYIFDTTIDTPVWKSGNMYYPGGFAKQPTAAKWKRAEEIVLLPKSDSQKCGVTELKARAISYLSHQAANRAALLSGLIGESFGGVEVGIGVLGKFSLGDNQTLQTIAKTTLSVAAMRAAEKGAYEILREIGHDPDDSLARLLEHYLKKNT